MPCSAAEAEVCLVRLAPLQEKRWELPGAEESLLAPVRAEPGHGTAMFMPGAFAKHAPQPIDEKGRQHRKKDDVEYTESAAHRILSSVSSVSS